MPSLIRFAAFMLLLCLVACQQQETLPTMVALPGVQPKMLATVFLSPTPGEAERRATEFANAPTPSAPTITPLPSATVYIGVFLEGGINPDGDVPIIDPTRALFQPDVTPVISRCRFAVADEVFGEGWRSNVSAVGALGCPVEDLQVFGGGVQVFERGVMYYQDSGSLWAITTEGGVRGDRYWSLAEPPEVEGGDPVLAPPGLIAPDDNLRGMWLIVPELRDRLGFARLPAQTANLSLQRFENGGLLADRTSGVVYILLANNIAFGPYN